MVSSSFLALPDDLVVDQVRVLYDCLTICIRSTAPSAVCPLCSQPAGRIHSRYQRSVADLPSGGRQSVLSLVVRKFFCQTSGCPRRIFAERFPDMIRPWARMTLRFCAALEAIGFATSGEAGARLATRLGIPTSPATVLRRLKAASPPASRIVTQVGIDDFAFRRGLKYGTMLVNLETHRVIDLLPDRAVATATTWFKEHPDIKIVSRDRGADYATAASQGAPQAVQVADRWHIVHNLSEVLSLVFEHSRAQLRIVSQLLVPPRGQEKDQQRQEDAAQVGFSSLTPSASGQPYRAPFIQQVQRARHESRLKRYEQMVELQQQGMTTAQVAQHLGLSTRTIRRWLAHEYVPEKRQRRRRPSLIDPYESYVLTRWQQGCHNGLQLWREIAGRGYAGSPKALYSYLARLRPAGSPSAKRSTTSPAKKRKGAPSSSGPSDPFLAKRAVRLLLRRSTALTAVEQEAVQMLRQMHPHMEVVYQLTQGFMSMLNQHQAELLDTWLTAVRGFGIAELERFGRGIEQDKAAVSAALTLPYSTGVVEGHVNRLKLIKRMMYGRAEFPLLRQRVLHVA
jgi:transposase